MKRRYLVTGLLIIVMFGKTQSLDSTYHKRPLSKTEIEVVFSYYNQDGNHSAITGGTGTEKLNVYATGINVSYQNEKNIFSLTAGGDAITSASTDRIDSIVSSASKTDLRSYAQVNYSRQVGNKGIELGIGTGFSIESDYLSLPIRIFFNYSEPSGHRTYNVAFEAFFDDLRWGRLNPDYRRPVTLIYPAELRYKEWYNIHNRYSYNLKTGFTQVINKRLITAIYPEFIYQHGLLATPFHRVYFWDASLRVENLPIDRIKFPVSLRANYFAGSQTVLKAGYGFYIDNFGIIANSIELEGAIKISPFISLTPFVKVYTQSGSTYFRPYSEHDPESAYYTSDYDLSAFNALKAGIAFHWAPFKYLSKKTLFNEINLRYSFFTRSDHLQSHIITSSFGISHNGMGN